MDIRHILNKTRTVELPLYGFLFLAQDRYSQRQFTRLLNYFQLHRFGLSFLGGGSNNCVFFGSNNFSRVRLFLNYLLYTKDPDSLMELD